VLGRDVALEVVAGVEGQLLGQVVELVGQALLLDEAVLVDADLAQRVGRAADLVHDAEFVQGEHDHFFDTRFLVGKVRSASFRCLPMANYWI